MSVIVVVMANFVGIFLRWLVSVGQLVHHSKELKAMYGECVAVAVDDSVVSTRFQHLRPAKHRIDKLMMPRSKAALNLTGLLACATKLGIRRRGFSSRHSGRCLSPDIASPGHYLGVFDG